MMTNKAIMFIFSIGICFLAGGIGSLFTTPNINTWYATLEKPFFNPPNWVFGPVWSVLYLLMGISLYLVWTAQTQKKERATGMKFFFAQLILNTLWSIIFFGLQSPLFALFVIIALWILIYLTIKNFFKVSKIAGQLLVPYIVWVSFATVLNLTIVILN